RGGDARRGWVRDGRMTEAVSTVFVVALGRLAQPHLGRAGSPDDDGRLRDGEVRRNVGGRHREVHQPALGKRSAASMLPPLLLPVLAPTVIFKMYLITARDQLRPRPLPTL